MALKKALFLGGAVLLLAACSDATAPGNALRDGAPVAAAKAGAPKRIVDPGTTTLPDDCKSGYYVRSGDKDVCVLALDQQY